MSGIPESTSESWANAEAKVKEAIKEKLGMDVDIERAHRVEKKKENGKLAKQKERPRTIVCKIKDCKQREAVIKEARKVKPRGLYIAEDLSKTTLKKRESQIPKMIEARKAGRIAYFILDRLIIRDKLNTNRIT